MNSTQRRLFLKSSAISVATISGLALIPQTVLAKWPASAFSAKKVPEALDALLGSSATADSTEIKIKAPDIAENGAVVPVTVSTDMSADSIAILAPKNPSPLVANFNLGEGAVSYVSTRIKMGATGDIIAVVKSGGKLYTTKKTVKVTIGGCGG